MSIALAITLGAPFASAQAPRALLLDVEPCADAPIETDALIARLEVELHDDGIEEVRLAGRGAPISRAPTEEVRVVQLALERCEIGAAAFAVSVEDLAGNVLVAQRIDVSGTAESARLRALALALAELLRSAPSAAPEPIEEAPQDDAPIVQHAPIEPAPPVAPAEPETRAASTAVAAAFVVRAFPSGGIAPLGGRLSVDVAALAPLVVRIDAEVVAGVALDPLGEIDVGLATAGIALAWAGALGRDVLLTLGGRVAAGVAWAEGRPYDPATPAGDGAGPVVALGGVCELDVRVVGPLSLRFGVEVGAAVLGFEARVGAIPVAAVSGGSLAGWAGLAITE
ncbi:hypothetical protein [Sandaracinus amylolyticus]|uniref:Uncharacterized protein n=1 Tax=Sandaracinus amylolyticus TaxID=927083 RepID=A0A0F6YH51_9BACT|nr:hypothetical protein [Sandaracinus amylolyticus]AKF05485.1 hypothetical protein DB32_002634 [Sandaracinus amylolyticus]